MTAPAINPQMMQKQPLSGQPQMPVPGATGMTAPPTISKATGSMAPSPAPAPASQGGMPARPMASSYFNAPGVGMGSPVPGQTTGGPAGAPTANPAGGSPPPLSPSVAGAPGSPPQAGGTDLSGVYNFFKSDLQNQQKQALAGTQADAAARGVYYGTPLTGSEADINTQYLRGLGQLQAGMYGNEQQNQLARLAIGTQLMGMMPQAAAGGIDPNLYQSLGQMFLPQAPGANVAAPRIGPAGQVGNQTQSGYGVGGPSGFGPLP